MKNKIKEHPLTDEEAMRLAERDKRAGKAPSTQARHFVHEEMEHAKKGEHTVRNPKQAVAIGLSKARKHGIPLRGKTKSQKKAA